MTLTELEARLTRLEDIHEIKNLQARYNYYVNLADPEKVVSCFAAKDPEVSVELADGGVYVGIEGVRRNYTVRAKQVRGYMALPMVMQPVIEINPDGKTAKGMWQLLACFARPKGDGNLFALWQQGKYDNEYVKEDGKWKFKKLCYKLAFWTPFDQGWVKQPIAASMTTDLMQPDRPSTMPLPYGPDRFNKFLPYPPEPLK